MINNIDTILFNSIEFIQKLESRIYELESILIKNQSNGGIVFIKDKKFKKYQEIYIKKD